MKTTIEKIRVRRGVAANHVDRKLLLRLRIFAVISAVLLGMIGYNVLFERLTLLLAALALGTGLAIGAVAGRMYKIAWHDEAQKVVSRLDKLGVALLVLYMGVELGKKWVFGHWLQGLQLQEFSLAFLAGLLFGRFLTMAQSVMRVLKDNDKIPSSVE